MKYRKFFGVALIAGSLLVQGCGFIIEKDKDEDKHKGHYPQYNYFGEDTNSGHDDSASPSAKFETLSWNSINGDSCRNSYFNTYYGSAQIGDCQEKDGYYWETTSSAKKRLPIRVQYLYEQDLGMNTDLFIEAFDNPFFQGSPVSVLWVKDFCFEEGQNFLFNLYVDNKPHYLRAYTTKKREEINLLQVGEVNLWENAPYGLYISQSGQLIPIDPGSGEDSADISINQVPSGDDIDSSSEASSSEGRIRLRLATTEGLDIPENRQIIVNLFDGVDFTFEPVHQFKFSTQNLLVQGNIGKAEIVTPEVAAGNYYVQVYIDGNGSEFKDAGEAGYVHSIDGNAAAISIQDRQTAVLDALLVIE